MHLPSTTAPVHAAAYLHAAAPQPNAITDQLHRCHAYAAAHGYQIPDDFVYIDNGASGLTTDRPGWNRMLRHAERAGGPPFEVLIAADLSRVEQFADPGLLDHWIVHLKNLGVRVECTDGSWREPATDADVGEYLMRRISDVADERERSVRTRRTAVGREYARQRRAERYFSGNAPYGFARVPEHDTPEGWHEAARTRNWRLAPAADGSVEVLQRIFACLADGMSLRHLAAELNDGSTPPPRGAAQWTASRISRIARNPIYVGDLIWSCAGRDRETLTCRDWLKDAPVARERFDQVQQLLRRRRL